MKYEVKLFLSAISINSLYLNGTKGEHKNTLCFDCVNLEGVINRLGLGCVKSPVSSRAYMYVSTSNRAELASAKANRVPR